MEAQRIQNPPRGAAGASQPGPADTAGQTSKGADTDRGRLERELRAAGGALGELATMRWERVRLAALERGHDLMAGLWAGLVLAAGTTIALVYAAQGLAALTAELAGDRMWVGRLAVGVLGLAGALAILSTRRARMYRLSAERIKAEPLPVAAPGAGA